MKSFVFCLMSFVFAIVASAQGPLRNRSEAARTASPTPLPSTLPNVVTSIEFADDTPIPVYLKVYGELVGKTVIPDKEVLALPDKFGFHPYKSDDPKKTHLMLTDDEKPEAIETLLEMHGVHLEPYGEKFIRALPRQGVRKHGIPLYLNPDDYELRDVSRVVSMALNVKYADIDGVNTILQRMLSDKGDLIPLKDSQKIVVTDTEMNLKRMLDMVKCIDVPNASLKVKMFPKEFKYATAKNVIVALQACVERSKQYEQEVMEGKQKKAVQQGSSQPSAPRPSLLSTLRRPGTEAVTSTAPKSFDTLSSAQDSTVLVRCHPDPIFIGDENIEHKLVIITWEENMNLFDGVIKELDVPPDDAPIEWQYDVIRLKYADAEDTSDKLHKLLIKKTRSTSSLKSGAGGRPQSGAGANAASKASGADRGAAESGDGVLDELIIDETVFIHPDKRINGLAVKVKPGRLHKELLAIIEKMDVKLSQVLIETAIIEVTLGKNLNTGVDWVQNRWTGKDPTGKMGGGGGSNSGTLSGMSDSKTYAEWFTEAKNALGSDASLSDINTWINNAMSSAGSVSPIGSGINYLFKSDKLNLNAVITAAKTDSHSKYIASPIIMTVDNKEATINATDMTYLLKGFQSSGNSYSTIAVPDYEQKELGIEIKVTPKINPNGTVMLTVEAKYTQKGAEQTIKYTSGNSDKGSSGLQDVSVPTTATREMSADVLLENVQTVILGGLTDTYKSESETGIPILKDIPIIGKWLFGKVVQDETRKELLIFMTPYVMDDGAAAQVEAIRRKKTLSDARPWDDRGWSASKLADPVSKRELLRRIQDEWRIQDEERKTKLALEREKVARAKKLQEMSKDEREVWLKMHKTELDAEAQDELEEKMLDEKSQEELKKLAAEVRAKKLGEAEKALKAAEAESAAENERGKLDAAKKAKTEGEAAKGQE